MMLGDEVELSRAARERLHKDQSLIDLLLDAGLDEDEIGHIFETLSGLVYGVWPDIEETETRIVKRQQKIADRARALVDELQTDDYLKHITVEDPAIRGLGAYAGGREPQKSWLKAESERIGGSQMRFVDYLSGLVELIESGHAQGFARSFYMDDVSKRGSGRFKTFSIRTVYRALQAQANRIGKKHLKHQNKLTARIVSTLIDVPVTANDVTQARIGERDQYWKE